MKTPAPRQGSATSGEVLSLLPLALAATDVSVEVAAGAECVGHQESVVRRSTLLHVTITGTGALIPGVGAGTRSSVTSRSLRVTPVPSSVSSTR